MRVVVEITPDIDPELTEELQRLTPRRRAKRLRVLAHAGLLFCPAPADSMMAEPPRRSPSEQTGLHALLVRLLSSSVRRLKGLVELVE